MERSNQPSRPECCRAEGQASVAQAGGEAERPIGGVHREVHEPQAGVAPRQSNSASKPLNAGEDDVCRSELNMDRAMKVRRGPTCRGLRAWRVNKAPFGSMETRSFPAALTTRAKREGRPNDKKGRPTELRESDRFIVGPGNSAQAEPTGMKGATGQCNPHRQPAR